MIFLNKSKLKDMVRRLEGSGQAPNDQTSLVASPSIECDVFGFKIKAANIHDVVDRNPKFTAVEDILEHLEDKYILLKNQKLW